jgi:hypothetical protein
MEGRHSSNEDSLCEVISMELIYYINIAELQGVQKSVKLCRKYGLLPYADKKYSRE